MKTAIINRAISVLLATVMLLSAISLGVYAEDTAWKPTSGTRNCIDIHSVGEFSDLEKQAMKLQVAYLQEYGVMLPVVQIVSTGLRSGDIFLTYDSSVASRAYEIGIFGGRLTIMASDDNGMNRGWSYVMARLEADGVVTVVSGDAVDYSQLRIAVSLADQVERDKDLFVVAYYRDYMALVYEAETLYLGDNAAEFTQDSVNAMTNTLMTLYSRLYSEYTVEIMKQGLNAPLERFYTVDLPAHQANPYPAEQWLPYEKSIRAAEEMLASNDYDIDMVYTAVAYINGTYRTIQDGGKKLGELRTAIDQFEEVFLPAYLEKPVFTEMWILYFSAITGAQLVLDDYDYTYETVVQLLTEVTEMANTMSLAIALGLHESSIGQMRKKDMINSVSFQTKTAYEGSVVRMSVNTKRDYNVENVIVFDENGYAVPIRGVSVAPVNRRRPTEQIVYVDIEVNLAPGVHTYTVYAVDSGLSTQTKGLVLLCGDPEVCSLTVK